MIPWECRNGAPVIEDYFGLPRSPFPLFFGMVPGFFSGNYPSFHSMYVIEVVGIGFKSGQSEPNILWASVIGSGMVSTSKASQSASEKPSWNPAWHIQGTFRYLVMGSMVGELGLSGESWR